MPNEPPNFPRLRAVYALKKVSQALASDVLSDGAISDRFKISINRPIELSTDVIVARPILFKAFRQALEGEAVTPLVDQDGKVLNAKVSIDAEGNALVRIQDKRLRFENAGLLSLELNKRSDQLARAIARHTLAKQEVERLQAIVLNPDFSDDKFLTVIAVLAASQESFGDALTSKLRSRQVALRDLLPEQETYWEQLAAPVVASRSLADFVASELLVQREFLLAGNPRKAMGSIAISFCAPALVPLELFRLKS